MVLNAQYCHGDDDPASMPIWIPHPNITYMKGHMDPLKCSKACWQRRGNTHYHPLIHGNPVPSIPLRRAQMHILHISIIITQFRRYCDQQNTSTEKRKHKPSAQIRAHSINKCWQNASPMRVSVLNCPFTIPSILCRKSMHQTL